MLQTSSSTKPINKNLSIALTDEGFFDYLSPYNFSNSSNHLKFLFFHLAIICLLLQSLAVAKNWTVPTNFTREISFAIPSGFNFFEKNSASPAFNNFKNSPSFAQNASPQETSLKKPNSALNASLFLPDASPTASLWQKQLAPGVASFRLRSFLTPFWLKTSHWLVFLTPEPNITALKSTSSSSTKSQGFSQSISVGSSTGASPIDALINTLSAQIGTNSSKSDSSSTTYTNTTILAQNGTLKINSGNDANIKGADLLAEDVILNTQNNLTIESLQNKTRSKSKSNSINGGGGANSVIAGFNYQSDKFERDWVDDQTSVIGTNSITINTGKNTNIKGAVVANITNATANEITSNSSAEAEQKQANWIDGGNLTLNTSTLTFENIFDREEKKSVGYGVQVGIAIGSKGGANGDGKSGDTAGAIQADARSSTSATTTSSTNSQSNNQNIGTADSTNKQSTPDATFTARNEGYIKEQTTKATIGGGTINVGGVQIFDNDANSANYGNLVSSTGGQNINDIIASNLNSPEAIQLAGLNRDANKTQVMTKDTITGVLNAKVSLEELVMAAKVAYWVSPLGVSDMIEDYTGQALTWAKGVEATFKEKGREFETAKVGANTV